VDAISKQPAIFFHDVFMLYYISAAEAAETAKEEAASVQSAFRSSCSIVAAGIIPECRANSRPPRESAKVGIARITTAPRNPRLAGKRFEVGAAAQIYRL
jgi:hypothetical protein